MNDFNEELANNTRDAMVSAMLRTVVSDPTRNLGSILDALDIEGDDGGGNMLLDHFRDVTIGELVTAAVEQMKRDGMVPMPEPDDLPNDREPLEPPPDSEAGPEDNLEDEKTTTSAETPRGGKKKSKKKKAPRNSERANLVKPSDAKAYQKAFVTFLRKGGHRDEDTGARARDIRADIGGDKDQLKEVVDQLLESKHIAKYGQAAGTRYYLP